MIDSCDPAIACWSDDGETFVVKDPSKFEKEIIPQFFKHSKFSSFVRQLNFYSFRKIKYADTIRLNPKLEAETANFWRFRHENFQRGQPHLLSEIKRMNGHKNTSSANIKKEETPAVAAATAACAGANGGNSEDMKNELDTLKKRIEEMNKSMTVLTSMVQKVSFSKSDEQHQQPAAAAATAAASIAALATESNLHAGAKRKNSETAIPDSIASQPSVVTVPPVTMAPITTDQPLLAPSNNLLPLSVDLQLAPEAVGSIDDLVVRSDKIMLSATTMGFEPLTEQEQEEAAMSTDAAADDKDILYTGAGNTSTADEDALIDLYHVGNDSEDDTVMQDVTASHFLPDPSSPTEGPSSAFDDNDCSVSLSSSLNHDVSCSKRRTQRPDPSLMERLSEALSLLPKEMQEQIVERLIAAITTTDLFTAPLSEAQVGKFVSSRRLSESDESSAVHGNDASSFDSASAEGNNDDQPTQPGGMPLAAATLAALLSHYSAEVKKHSKSKSKSNNAPNTIPVIPVHA